MNTRGAIFITRFLTPREEREMELRTSYTSETLFALSAPLSLLINTILA